jgi:hypothetical protein
VRLVQRLQLLRQGQQRHHRRRHFDNLVPFVLQRRVPGKHVQPDFAFWTCCKPQSSSERRSWKLPVVLHSALLVHFRQLLRR